ncbi:MAG: carbohydrate ABC transporter permease [Tepidisphaeraceae bacterium]
MVPESTPRPSFFARYLSGNAWAHAALLFGTIIFMIPFVYMVSTSVKVDEELPEQKLLPHVPMFRGTSPYVREVTSADKPADATSAQWASVSESLVARAKAKASSTQPSVFAAKVDRDALNNTVANQLTTDLAARINGEAWKQGDAEVQKAFDELLTSDVLNTTMNDRVARFELRRIQFRTIDAHMVTLADGPKLAEAVKAESANVSLIPLPDAAVVAYQDLNAPVTLRFDFAMPSSFEKFHKLIVSILADDSWHAVDATLDVGGVTWRSQRTTYLAQNRPLSMTFQPPSFDDTTNKPRTWVPLRTEGQTPATVAEGAPATLRLTLSPVSTPGAITAKVTRNYKQAFFSVPFWTYTFNSILLVALQMAGSLFSASFVAYAFARLNWPGRSVAFLLVLSTMMLPGQVTMIPSFMIWKTLGWYNTLNPLWVGSWFGSAFFIFLMVQHMRTIPKELEEAARIDGLNALQTWYYVILPQLKPTLAAIAVMTFMGAWNEFMGPLIYLRDQDKFPLSLGLFSLKLDQGGDWTLVMAGSVLMTLPVMVVFFLCQRYFIQGVTLTGMKG